MITTFVKKVAKLTDRRAEILLMAAIVPRDGGETHLDDKMCWIAQDMACTREQKAYIDVRMNVDWVLRTTTM